MEEDSIKYIGFSALQEFNKWIVMPIGLQKCSQNISTKNGQCV